MRKPKPRPLERAKPLGARVGLSRSAGATMRGPKMAAPKLAAGPRRRKERL